jgi:hypothetical protein
MSSATSTHEANDARLLVEPRTQPSLQKWGNKRKADDPEIVPCNVDNDSREIKLVQGSQKGHHEKCLNSWDQSACIHQCASLKINSSIFQSSQKHSPRKFGN